MEIAVGSKDYDDLKVAVGLLEAPTITDKMARIIGNPIEFALKKLPKGAEKAIHELVKSALQKAASTALWSLNNEPGKTASPRTNKLFAAASGAVGGAFGIAALAIELPISTTIMLRAIADVARSEGFDLTDLRTKESCLEVLTLGDHQTLTMELKQPITEQEDSQPKQCGSYRKSWRMLRLDRPAQTRPRV